MRFVLVGSGSVGQRHARVLRALDARVEIVALRSGHGGRLPEGMVDKETTDGAAALAMRPNGAIVADPAPRHPDSAIPFIRAGVPVLLEKPVAVDADGMQALLVASRDNSRVLVGYVLRHDPALQEFRKALREGAVGSLVMLHLEAGQALSDWRPGQDAHRSISARRDTGGGVLFELSHEVDSARWLLGETAAVQSCSATRGELKLEVEDTAQISMKTGGGVSVLIQIDMVRRPAVRCYRAVGAKGTLTWNAADGQVRIEKGDGGRVLYHAPPNRDDLYRRQMQHFLAVARGDAAPLCPLADGAKTLAVVLEARHLAGLDAVAA